MSLPQHWAITSELTSNELSPSELAQGAAAAQVHLTRDVAMEWPEAALVTVAPFPDPKSVPFGYDVATIMGMDQMPQGAAGFHYTKHKRPAASIGFDAADKLGVWTTAMHELGEGTADRSGNRTVACVVPGVGPADVLVEIADPPEAFVYYIDGLPATDFVTRGYYGPHRWRTPQKSAGGGPGVTVPGVPAAYSFCKRINTPCTVVQGGYLSMRKPDGEWVQVTWFGGLHPAVRVLGRRDEDDPRSHREWVDSKTRELALGHVGMLH